MRACKVAIAAFTVATIALLFWLLVSWFGYGMDTFDCPAFGSGARACSDTAVTRSIESIVPAVGVWIVLGWLAFKPWGKH